MHLVHSLTVLCLTVALTVAEGVSAQRRPAGITPQEVKVGAAIALTVAGTPYQYSGQAVCEHLSRGSIYDIAAQALAGATSSVHSPDVESSSPTLVSPHQQRAASERAKMLNPLGYSAFSRAARSLQPA